MGSQSQALACPKEVPQNCKHAVSVIGNGVLEEVLMIVWFKPFFCLLQHSLPRTELHVKSLHAHFI